jgi:hypothetical protein
MPVRRAAIRAAARAAPTIEGKNLVRALALYADRAGVARPSLATLARDMGVHERNVQRQVRRLEACGRLVRLTPSSGGRGLTNEWLVVAEPEPETPAHAPPFGEPETPAPAPGFGSRNPGDEDEKPRRSRPETPAPAPPQEIEEKKTQGGRARVRARGGLRRLADLLGPAIPSPAPPTSEPKPLGGDFQRVVGNGEASERVRLSPAESDRLGRALAAARAREENPTKEGRDE